MQLPTQILGRVHRNDSRGNVTEHKRKIRTYRRERKRMEQKKSSYPLQEFLKGQVKPCLSTEDYTKLLRLINDFVRIRFLELAKKENQRERLIYSAQEIKAICKTIKCSQK